MKIGIYVPRLDPGQGGGFTFIVEMLQGLCGIADRTTHEFTVFTESPENIIDTVLPRDAKIAVKEVPFFPYDSSMMSLLRRLASRIAREIGWPDPITTKIAEVFRAAEIEFMIFLSIHPGGAVFDIPYLIVVWDLQHRTMPWFPEVSSRAEWSVREAINSVSLRRASIVLTGTQVGAHEIERFYQVPPENIRILPHPTPNFALAGSPPRQDTVTSNLGISQPYLLYPAQFWPHKNHVNLIEALKKLHDEFALAFDLVCVGQDYGNLGHVKERVAQLGLEAQVHFPGFVSRGDLLQFYRNAFALAYLSFGGPENLPPLEAFALGCPVIASNTPGAREQLGDAALLVSPVSPIEIARAVNELFRDSSLRQRLVLAGKQRTRGRTREDFARGLVNIFDEFEPVRRCWGR